MFNSRLSILVLIVFSYSLSVPAISCGQPLNNKKQFSRQDTLRGSITAERAWWDVLYYDIAVSPDYTTKTIKGSNHIKFKVVKDGQYMQLDLQTPMEIRAIEWNAKQIQFSREGNAFHLVFPEVLKQGRTDSIMVSFEGKPTEAIRPPWDGGWIWKKDEKGRPWISVACQGLGASVWYPCKDHQSDEPDNGAAISITVPDTLVAVANGKLKDKKVNVDHTTTYTWSVVNPINNYNIIPYIGKYVTWHEDYMGEKGKLDCDYWVMDYNLEKAKQQFAQVAPMMKCLEYWFGPYPFYEDGYKLVESPHLGMEHQSAIAYGNKYRNGYSGKDLSESGWGAKWDFIILHESAHEWFANNITTKDLADMWVHESFANYSETLYTECEYGKEAGIEYVTGIRRLIRNDIPIIGTYGVNQEGSGDMYYKGGNILHTIRATIGNDDKFRQILRGLNKDFYHKTVSTKEIEEYISKKSGIDFSKTFDQYLRRIQIPTLEYYFIADSKNKSKLRLYYRWIDCEKGFNMPVRVNLSKSNQVMIKPIEEEWRSVATTLDTPTDPDHLPDIRNRSYYIKWIENRKIVPPGKTVRD
ncbi:MAG TPA: M1 family metallopeptidase [Chitinophagaceae bacterium]|nr:M1 family metallopeptidase [Chitinophagaceae bacterium]